MPTTTAIDHNGVEAALRDAGSSWSAAQAHGLLCGRLALQGADGRDGWLAEVLDITDTDTDTSVDPHTVHLLDSLCADSHRQLAERQSDFAPLLPGDSEPASVVAGALAEWCEGFLHGLVSRAQDDAVRRKLAEEPISDIIKDLLEMTRASADDEDDQEDNEEALTELNEYIRVAAQLIYEELAETRHSAGGPSRTYPQSDALH